MPILPRSRRARIALLLGVGVVALLALYLPALMALGNGWAAKEATNEAVKALKEGDLDEAREHVAEAQEDTADMHRATAGLTGTWWGWLPGGDQDRRDVDHLADSIDHLMSIFDTVLDAYPAEPATDGFLVEDDRIDLDALSAILDEYDGIAADAHSAERSLRQVRGDTAVLGWALSGARDEALTTVEPLAGTMDLVRPLVPHLPRLLGDGGPQGYLVTLLNPAEQRFSGGATLTFAPIFINDGKVTQGWPLTGTTEGGDFDRITWQPVEGNPFHAADQQLRVSTATLAPSWSVAGEELLRAWREARGSNMTGVIALDVVALQDLMDHIGPFDVPGYGRLDSSNLAEKLIGSYDELTSIEAFTERSKGSVALINRFRTGMLSPSKTFEKLETLTAAAEGRHVAVYYRDPAIQESLDRMGLSGDLSETPHDYVGVFNQATAGHKADYWQRRTVTSDVQLRADGSADVRLTIDVFNDSPPPATGVPRKLRGYVHRANKMALAAFLPTSAADVRAELGGVQREPRIRSFYGRPFVRFPLHLRPQARQELVLRYTVPTAAVVSRSGLRYRLAVDPHSLVDPQALHLTVRAPAGHTFREVPDGWHLSKGAAHFDTDDLDSSPRWTITLERDSSRSS